MKKYKKILLIPFLLSPSLLFLTNFDYKNSDKNFSIEEKLVDQKGSINEVSIFQDKIVGFERNTFSALNIENGTGIYKADYFVFYINNQEIEDPRIIIDFTSISENVSFEILGLEPNLEYEFNVFFTKGNGEVVYNHKLEKPSFVDSFHTSSLPQIPLNADVGNLDNNGEYPIWIIITTSIFSVLGISLLGWLYWWWREGKNKKNHESNLFLIEKNELINKKSPKIKTK